MGSANSCIIIIINYSHAVGPNAASSSAEGAHGGSVASPVQLVKPVADDGSCDVPV